MSWSVNLSGPVEMVKRELIDMYNAVDAARDGMDHAYETLHSKATVNLSGNAYVSGNEIGGSASFGVTLTKRVQPPDPPDDEPLRIQGEVNP